MMCKQVAWNRRFLGKQDSKIQSCRNTQKVWKDLTCLRNVYSVGVGRAQCINRITAGHREKKTFFTYSFFIIHLANINVVPPLLGTESVLKNTMVKKVQLTIWWDKKRCRWIAIVLVQQGKIPKSLRCRGRDKPNYRLGYTLREHVIWALKADLACTGPLGPGRKGRQQVEILCHRVLNIKMQIIPASWKIVNSLLEVVKKAEEMKFHETKLEQ